MKFSQRLQSDMRWDQIQSAIEHERHASEQTDEEQPRTAGPTPGLSMRRDQ